MATFEEGLLLGMSLRRRKKGGTKDKLFEEVVENGMLLCSHEMPDNFSFELKAWMPNIEKGFPFPIDENLLNYDYVPLIYNRLTSSMDYPSEKTADDVRYEGQLIGAYAGILPMFAVVKKDDEPLYMTGQGYACSYPIRHYDDIKKKIGTSYNYTYTEYSYRMKANFTVKSVDITNFENLSFVPQTTYNSASHARVQTFNGSYSASSSISFSITLGYDTYMANSDADIPPQESVYFLRTEESLVNGYFSYATLITDGGLIVKSNLTPDELADVFNEVALAANKELGFDRFIPEIVPPTS